MSALSQRRLTASPDALINVVDKEAVLLDLKSEQYFGLNETGARFWTTLVEAGTFGAALATLQAEYDVDSEQLRADLEAFVNKLVERGLVTLDA